MRTGTSTWYLTVPGTGTSVVVPGNVHSIILILQCLRAFRVRATWSRLFVALLAKYGGVL